jgi:uncharacterized iron-regulated membrane protein
MKVPSKVFLTHQVLGLAVGALLLVIGLTGSAIVFWEPLDRQMYPDLYRSSPQPAPSLDRVLAAARTHYRQVPAEGVYVREGHVYSVGFQTPEHQYLEVFVDPVTYRVRGARIWEHTLVGVLYRLHYQLLLGEAGNWVTGITAFVLAALSITGVVLWPGWKRLRAGFALRWRSRPHLVAFDLHKLSGLFTAVFLGILGITGASFMFYDPFQAAVYALTGTPRLPDPVSTPIAGRVPLSLDALVAKAAPALAGAELTRVSLPTKPDGAVQLRAEFATEGPASRQLRIAVDRYSGKVLRVRDGRRPNAAELILNWIGPLHFGSYGGLFTQVMYVFVGLAPGGLFLTGFWLWLQKLRRRRAATAAEAGITTVP